MIESRKNRWGLLGLREGEWIGHHAKRLLDRRGAGGDCEAPAHLVVFAGKRRDFSAHGEDTVGARLECHGRGGYASPRKAAPARKGIKTAGSRARGSRGSEHTKRRHDAIPSTAKEQERGHKEDGLGNALLPEEGLG